MEANLRSMLKFLFAMVLFFSYANAQTVMTETTASPASTAASTTAKVTSTGTKTSKISKNSSTTADSAFNTVPDVYLSVPTLSVGRIELEVEELQADLNLNAAVAGLVSINAGVSLGIQKVNITISEVDVQLELVVRLGHLVDIVNRVFQSLDLNPLLISALNATTELAEAVVGAVDGLLGSITQGGSTINFLVDNLGNIVQDVGGVSTIVGNYLTNMTEEATQTLSNGLVEKTFSYSPLGALVDIIFNTAGQVVQASVVKQSASSTASASSTGSTSTGSSGATTTGA